MEQGRNGDAFCSRRERRIAYLHKIRAHHGNGGAGGLHYLTRESFPSRPVPSRTISIMCSLTHSLTRSLVSFFLFEIDPIVGEPRLRLNAAAEQEHVWLCHACSRERPRKRPRRWRHPLAVLPFVVSSGSPGGQETPGGICARQPRRVARPGQCHRALRGGDMADGTAPPRSADGTVACVHRAPVRPRRSLPRLPLREAKAVLTRRPIALRAACRRSAAVGHFAPCPGSEREHCAAVWPLAYTCPFQGPAARHDTAWVR
jgi:hypothetical protein